MVLVIKVFFYKKEHVTLFLGLLKKKKELCNMNFFLVYPVFQWAIMSKKSCQKRGVQKKDKTGGRPDRAGCL